MSTTKRTTGLRAVEEPDIELEVFEEPIDTLFPRLPNIVSRRGHRALKIKVRVQGTDVIPPNATAVVIEAEVLTYGPDRIGSNRHVFRHRLTWGTKSMTFPLRARHRPPYGFDVVVPKQLGDDHLGEGPYDAVVKVTPQGPGLAGTRSTKGARARVVDPDLKTTIRFISM